MGINTLMMVPEMGFNALVVPGKGINPLRERERESE